MLNTNDLFNCAAVKNTLCSGLAAVFRKKFLHGFSNTFLTFVQKKCKHYLKTRYCFGIFNNSNRCYNIA